MGNHNSGRWAGVQTRQVVEDCLGITVEKLSRVIRHRSPGRFEYSWGSRARVALDLRDAAGDQDEVIVGLSYHKDGRSYSDAIVIERLPMNFGGRRWWFSCPKCERRCGRIYLPPARSRFGCRSCYNLTYRSCNLSRQDQSLYRYIAGELGSDAKHANKLMNESLSPV